MGVTSRNDTATSASQPTGLRVRRCDPFTDPRWEAFVSAHPNALIYHSPAWMRVLQRGYGHKVIGLACEDAGGQLRGVLPLAYSRGVYTGTRLASLPRTPVTGPLALDVHALGLLVETAVTLAARRLGVRLELRTQSTELDGLVNGLVGVPWEETYVLHLPERPELLRFGTSRNHARIKWAVNKADRMGVRVRLAEKKADLRAWYPLYLDAMRRHVAVPRPYRFFEALWDELQPVGMLRLLLAEQQERQPSMLAGSMLLMAGVTVFYAYNGVLPYAMSLRPNDAIQWRAIHDACRDGYSYYDFGEVIAGNCGLASFKTKWGAQRRCLYQYTCPPPRPESTGPGRSNGHASKLAAIAWQHLPLRMTAVLGEGIYRYV